MTEISKNAELQQSCINAVKSRFFAQYYGLEVAKHSTKKYFVKHIMDKIGEHYFLELTPIEKITDEDVIYCVELMGKKVLDSEIDGFRETFIEAFINKEFYGTFYPYKVCEIIDFLRSKGYAIPFMNYSIDDLIKIGWVQLL